MSERATGAADARIAAVAAELGLVRPQVSELEGGIANHSYRLRDDRHDYVLRFTGEATPGLGANGDSERAMQSLAAAAGLAPAIVLASPSRGFLVTRYAAGRMPGRSELRRTGMLRRVGGWIARLHGLDPPPGPAAVDIGARAAEYLARLESVAQDSSAVGLGRCLAARRAALPPPARLAPCHHDLHHRNFLDQGDRLLVVDWEYAGPGDPAADLAACIGYHDLDAGLIDGLLAGYGLDSPALRARIAALGWIFDCLWYGWNASAAGAGLAIDREQQSVLAARLAR